MPNIIIYLGTYSGSNVILILTNIDITTTTTTMSVFEMQTNLRLSQIPANFNQKATDLIAECFEKDKTIIMVIFSSMYLFKSITSILILSIFAVFNYS